MKRSIIRVRKSLEKNKKNLEKDEQNEDEGIESEDEEMNEVLQTQPLTEVLNLERISETQQATMEETEESPTKASKRKETVEEFLENNNWREMEWETVDFDENYLNTRRTTTCTLEEDKIDDPLSIWSGMFDKEMIEIVVNGINQRIDQKAKKKIAKTTANEVKAFIGCLYYIAGCKSHLSMKELYDEEYGLKFIRSVFSYSRFETLLRYFRCDDKDKREVLRSNGIIGVGVHELTLRLNENLKKLYVPGECLCIDEKMEAFEGQAQGVMYNPDKPIKHGFEYILCCTREPVLCIKFVQYFGKKTLNENEPVGKQLVNLVTSGLPKDHYLIQMDSRFINMNHLPELKEKGIDVIGTVKRTFTKKFGPFRTPFDEQIDEINAKIRDENKSKLKLIQKLKNQEAKRQNVSNNTNSEKHKNEITKIENVIEKHKNEINEITSKINRLEKEKSTIIENYKITNKYNNKFFTSKKDDVEIKFNSFVPKKTKSVGIITTGDIPLKIEQKSQKSQINVIYNNSKYPVDIFNKLCSATRIPFRGNRCTFAMFKNILEIVGTNCYETYSHFNEFNDEDQRISHQEFMRYLGKTLCVDYLYDKVMGMSEAKMKGFIKILEDCGIDLLNTEEETNNNQRQMEEDDLVENKVQMEEDIILKEIISAPKTQTKGHCSVCRSRTTTKCQVCGMNACGKCSIVICGCCMGLKDPPIGRDILHSKAEELTSYFESSNCIGESVVKIYRDLRKSLFG